ncbi:hypothetical protein DPMN_145308 [Dreissena polymorpha]|uniref:Uncharacterized protein n=1 Tax=Dreissena polymorpha TaxID=45954 RepID=A0A9D4F6F5_DREPO|nr:hypothetical protein DPMN_145308 [Dreissena polymorpha]
MMIKVFVLALVCLCTVLETEAKKTKCCLSGEYDRRSRSCKWREGRRAGLKRYVCDMKLNLCL